MVIYEVNVQIDPDIADAYYEWLVPHIEQMLAFDGFQGAKFLKLESETDADDDMVNWSVHYFVLDMDHLRHYFEHHAAEMRAGGVRRFGERFRANRRILDVVETFQVVE
jgi:hypothetical protein